MQEFYTPQEIAQIIRIDINTIYEYIRMGKLPAAKFGNRYRISREDFEMFVKERRTAGEGRGDLVGQEEHLKGE
ncbi:MAG: helix-turn-helix domain-containing protein [bacterium]|nr:helix-turn-helix domain-containing protein [bacterium]